MYGWSVLADKVVLANSNQKLPATSCDLCKTSFLQVNVDSLLKFKLSSEFLGVKSTIDILHRDLWAMQL